MEQAQLLAQVLSVAENVNGNVLSQAENGSGMLEGIGGIPPIFTFLGLMAGFVVLCWTVLSALRSYLHIDLSVDLREDRSLSALTTVENRIRRMLVNKKIDNACLLVGPESESPIDTFNCISRHSGLGYCVASTNEIAAYVSEAARIHHGPEGRLLIFLPFYYSENIGIGDERVSYRSPINTEEVPHGIPYSVRFFIYDSKRYHQSTHDSFVL